MTYDSTNAMKMYVSNISVQRKKENVFSIHKQQSEFFFCHILPAHSQTQISDITAKLNSNALTTYTYV